MPSMGLFNTISVFQVLLGTLLIANEIISFGVNAVECTTTFCKDVEGRWIFPAGTFGNPSMQFYAVNNLGMWGSNFTLKFDCSNIQGMMIQNPRSGKCLDIFNAAMSEGFDVDIWTCVSSARHERFIPVVGDAGFYLIASHSQLCLGTMNEAVTQGTHLVQNKCMVGNRNQQWNFKETSAGSRQYFIVHAASGFVINIWMAGTSDGDKVVVWPQATIGNDIWALFV